MSLLEKKCNPTHASHISLSMRLKSNSHNLLRNWFFSKLICGDANVTFYKFVSLFWDAVSFVTCGLLLTSYCTEFGVRILK